MSTTNIPAVFIVFKKGNQILLVLRENTGWKDGHYTMPAGHVEARESFRQAAVRESLEEVGLTVALDDLEHLLTLHEIKPTEGRISTTLEATSWQGEPYNAEPHMHGEVAWFDLDKLPDNMVPQALYSLEQIKAGQTYAEFGEQQLS
jgi:8-oxo-dGTP diphosphatase